MVAVVAAVACGGGPRAPADDAGPDAATVDAATDAGALVPEAPAPPAPPVFLPCPEGWQTVGTDPPVCEPWPDGSRPVCEGASAALPGAAGCRAIGTPCPAGEWPEGLPADREILFVRASGEPDGVGTTEAPFGRIADAVRAGGRGTILALGKGTFDGAVVLAEGMTLWGACTAETLLTSAVESESAGVVTVNRPDTAVRNLTIGGARPGLWVAPAAAAVDVEDVVIEGAQFVGIVVFGGTLAGRRVVVRDTVGRPGDRLFGRGLDVEGGGQVTLAEVAFERNHDVAVYAGQGETVLELADFVIRSTEGQQADRTRGHGVDVALGASIEMNHGVIEDNREVAFAMADAGTNVRMTDVVVRETRSQDARRILGHGIELALGARAELTRVRIERNRNLAVAADDDGTVLVLSDAVIRDTQSQENDETFGRGVDVAWGARVEMTRAVVERSAEAAVVASEVGSTLVLTDVRIRDIAAQASDGNYGRGLSIQSGAHGDVVRATIERARDIAVFASEEGTTLDATDLVVRDTASRSSDGRRGRALNVQLGAQAQIDRALLERSHEVGILAWGTGTALQLANVVVTETAEAACGADTCAGAAGGIALGAYQDARVGLGEFLLSRSALCALQLSRGGEIDAHDGEVSTNVIGANVQTEGFDPSRLMERVIYRDNERNFDAAALPVPDLDTDP